MNIMKEKMNASDDPAFTAVNEATIITLDEEEPEEAEEAPKVNPSINADEEKQ